MSVTGALAGLGLLVLVLMARGEPAPKPGEVASSPPPPAAEAGPTPDPWRPPAERRKASLWFDHFENLGTADGLPSERVTTVLAEPDELWVGTDQGLARRRDGRWTYWTEDDGLGHRYVTSLARDPITGDLWVSTFGGLSRLSADRVTNFTQLDSGLMNDVVYQVAVADGVVWAATAAGTSVYDPRTDSWELWDHRNSIMHEPWCYSVAVGGGRTFIGVWGGGVVELDHRTGLWREYRDPDHEMEIDLLRDDGPIHDVTAFVAWEPGLLWQATYFGLSRYDGQRWRTFRQADTGIPGDFINHVSARGGIAFLGTDQGFGTLDGETAVTYRRTEEGTCQVTVFRDGQPVEERTLPTAPADNYVLWTQPGERDVWLATGRGLSHGTLGGS